MCYWVRSRLRLLRTRSHGCRSWFAAITDRRRAPIGQRRIRSAVRLNYDQGPRRDGQGLQALAVSLTVCSLRCLDQRSPKGTLQGQMRPRLCPSTFHVKPHQPSHLARPRPENHSTCLDWRKGGVWHHPARSVSLRHLRLNGLGSNYETPPGHESPTKARGGRHTTPNGFLW